VEVGDRLDNAGDLGDGVGLDRRELGTHVPQAVRDGQGWSQRSHQHAKLRQPPDDLPYLLGGAVWEFSGQLGV